MSNCCVECFLDEYLKERIKEEGTLGNCDFGGSSSLRQAIAEVFDKFNSNPESDLTLRFRDPLSKNLLKVA